MMLTHIRVGIKLIQVSSLLLLCIAVLGCAPAQRAYKSGEGYQVLPAGNKNYRIEYFSDSSKHAEEYFKVTASQLCLENYKVLYSHKDVLNFDMYVPISGNNVNIGRQEFIQRGEVVCKGEVSSEIPLTNSLWKEFNKETGAVKPVGKDWIFEVLKVSTMPLINLPSVGASQALAKTWGKPRQQENMGDEVVSVWVKGGDSWFPNQVMLLEEGDCLKLIVILPGTSAYMLGSLQKQLGGSGGLMHLIIQGVIPAYFYKPENCK